MNEASVERPAIVQSLPQRGEHTHLGGWRFEVLNADNRRIRLLEAYREQRPDSSDDDQEDD